MTRDDQDGATQDGAATEDGATQDGATLPPGLRRLVTEHAPHLGAFGVHGRWTARTESTNDEAARWAESGAPEGAWVVADEQTAGRGRRGRVWASPPAAGLYVSMVFRPTGTIPVSNDPATGLLTLMAGVAAAEGIRRATGTVVDLKWPNDIMAAHAWRKVGGILAEAVSAGGVVSSIVVGVGLNLAPAAHPPDVSERAISLYELREPAQAVNRDVVLVALLASMAEWRSRLLNGGGPAMLDAWRALSPSSQRRGVRWRAAEGSERGVTAGIDDSGALLVETAAGVRRVVAGELEWD